MAEGSDTGTVNRDESVGDKTVSLIGVEFRLTVVRDMRGTHTIVEAIERKPQYPQTRKLSYNKLHSQPYDADL